VKKTIAIVGVVAALAACTPQQVPDSGRGVGFNDYADFELDRARREAALSGTGSTAFPQTTVPPGQPTGSTQAIPSADLQAAGIGQASADVGAPLSAINPQAGAPTVTPAPQTSNPAISDENDFSAVSSRESIESDAQRRQQQAAAREVVQPTALPTRSLLSGQGRFQRNCAAYNNADAAQRDFLSRGGPERDPRGIDPDGDGFACGWDPAPFRLAAGR